MSMLNIQYSKIGCVLIL